MTSWCRWDLWRQMNFSLRDDKVVNRIEHGTNGPEKVHLSSVSKPKSDGECVEVSEEMKCMSRVTDFHPDASHEWLAITLASVKYFIQTGIPQVRWGQSDHEMPQTDVMLHSKLHGSLPPTHPHLYLHTLQLTYHSLWRAPADYEGSLILLLLLFLSVSYDDRMEP